MQTYKEKGVMFLAGFGVACLLAFSVGAAQRNANQADRYDAHIVLNGIGLQIVDHQTNTFYLYGPNVEQNGYVLGRIVDLNLAGKAEIPIVTRVQEDAPDE